MKRIALRTTSGTPLIRYADSAGGGIQPTMNLRHQVNKFNERALRARQTGDHSVADYFENLRDHMLAEAEAGRPRPFSHYLPQVQEEFGDHISRRQAVFELDDEQAKAFMDRVKQGPIKVKMGPPQKVKGISSEDLAKLLGQGNEPSGSWYHASPHDLPVGTTLVPGGAPAASQSFYDQGFGEDRGMLQDMGGGRAQHVWMTPDRDDADFWSAVNGAPHIYEVKPHDDPRPWNGTGTDGWVAPAATITRKVAYTDEERQADLQRLMEKSNQERKQRHNTSSKIYRGLKLDLPPELEDHIKRYSQPAMEPEQVGQHLNIGPAILDHLERAHPRRENPFHEGDEDMGLGRHWTTNKRFAEIAAMQGGPYGARHSIVLEADHPGEDYLEHEHPAVGGSFQDSSGNPRTPGQEEEEYTLKPGTRVNVTSVNLNGNEVLHDPHYAKNIEKDYGIPYPGGPSQRLAGRSYTDEERAQHKQQGWRGPPCEDPAHEGEIMGRCPDCGRRVAPEQKVAYWDETPWLNAAWDEDLDDDEEEPVLPERHRRGR